MAALGVQVSEVATRQETALRDATARRPRLSDGVVQAIRAGIADGTLHPGSQLPTEGRLCERYGVSRTVVREAITRLASAGLVTPRQGAGVFVNEPRHVAVGALVSEIADKLTMVLNMLEVRMAVEIESAALAAQRRSASQEADIMAAITAFETSLANGEPTAAADFAFHRAIAAATNNPFYVEILDVLGRRTIPRDIVSSMSAQIAGSSDYQERLQAEHRAILAAISNGDADSARDAMRKHLSASRRRYNGLLRDGEALGRPLPQDA